MAKDVIASARPKVVAAEVAKIKKFLAEQIQPQHSKEEFEEILEALVEDLQFNA